MAKSKNNDKNDENLENLDLSLESLDLGDIEAEIADTSEEEYEYVEIEEGDETSEDEEYEYVEVDDETGEEELAEEITTEEVITIAETPSEDITNENIVAEETPSTEEDLSLDEFNFDSIDEDIQQKEDDFESLLNNDEKIDENTTETVEETITEEQYKNVEIEDIPDVSFVSAKPDAVLKDFKEISSENLVIKTLTDKSFNKICNKAKIFNNNFGQITYSGKDKANCIILNEIDFEELANWNIIIFRRNEIAISEKDKEIKINKEDKNAIRIANLYGPEGRAQKLYDIDKIDLVEKDSKTPIQKLEAGNFFLKELSSDWGVSITDFTIVGLSDKYGKSIEIPENCDGLIVGPNKSVLYFDNIKEIVVAKSEADRGQEDNIQEWLSGNIDDNMYKFDTNSNSDEYIGSEGNNIIHINAGYSTYGWNVVFENGIRMSLADVREYQSRHGKLPTSAGMVIRGAKTLTFSNVEKILIYQPAQYFGYGFGNPIG